jgi:esterase/lipase superfamily enzyme
MMRLRAFLCCLLLMAGFAAVAPVSAFDLLLGTRIEAAVTAGQPGEAVALVEEALAAPDLEPIEREDLLRQLAELHLRLGRPSDAAEAYAKLAAAVRERLGPAAPELAGVWQQAAGAYMAAGDTAGAVDAYLEAIRVDAAGGTPPGDNALMPALEAAIAGEPSPRRRARLEAEKARLRSADAEIRPKQIGPVGGGSPTEIEKEGYWLVKIYYGTNRKRTDDTRPSDVYGAARGDLDYGTATVSIPKIHTPGALEAPTIFTFDVTENPDRHIILTRVDPAPKDRVFAEMRSDLAAHGSNEAFVFIHGFNVTFADAARRTAQIAHDMSFDGLPIMFSWPSQGSMLGYLSDSAVIQLSGRMLLGFLEDVVQATGATRIHLIGHSMGNRALTEALELYALKHAGEPPAFDEVLFTAPDLDAGLFANMAQRIQPAVHRMTLYASKNDWALKVSHALHGDAPRAGEGAAGTLLPPMVDSIDMSVLGEDMFAHSYFADDTSALTDILSLFWKDAPPDRRCGMTPSPPADTAAEWSLEPSLCDGSAMLAALRLLRSERIGNLSDALAAIEKAFPGADPEQRAQIEAALRRLFQS